MTDLKGTDLFLSPYRDYDYGEKWLYRNVSDENVRRARIVAINNCDGSLLDL
ncbi:MAG TPA: hypothetical protein VGC14_24300 [Rhizobium sp.]